MIEILSPREVEAAKPAGELVGRILSTIQSRVVPGTNLLEIDEWAAEMIRDAGATSCYVDYAPSFGRGPFGHHICTSVEDAVLHGLPYDRALRKGELLTLDIAVIVDGWACDSALTFGVGGTRPEDVAMVDATRVALEAGIAHAQVGNRIGDVSHAIGEVLRGAGFRINGQFGGHGIGSTMHQDPHVANDGAPGRGYALRPGLLLAIEPWVMAGTDELRMDADGWTLRSADGSRTAHSEHTVAITEDGPVVLTRRADEVPPAAPTQAA
ncbi:type I methionyl aminopeptidase [Agrococcus sp. SGAir0287]|uniref:type I methionyl aminopeptidase n=1 Tax=Agrococcus sp. SGAir0287 TaxID=2070347 RepID=UPI0010CD0474|nr:type I methionyl aminopeptidase [Agrococcus sp. SGAir0287]QCR20467.1 type I methionyl aminopeptidase [Agrococcus sp. SGAir0287]